jgi:hypothetical protein
MERLLSAASPATSTAEGRTRPVLISIEDEKLASRIERAIRRGTCDKVRELRVEIRKDCVVLSGRCGTFYSKQLAQHAAMPLTDGKPLVNQIEVW